LAGIDKYRISEYPRLKSPMEQFIEQLTGGDSKGIQNRVAKELGPLYTTYQAYKNIESMQGIQARMLFEFQMD